MEIQKYSKEIKLVKSNVKNDFISVNLVFKLHTQIKHLISLLEHHYYYYFIYLFTLNKS